MKRPDYVLVLTQRVSITSEENLQVPCGPEEDGDSDHGHAAYGVYQRSAQAISLDSKMGFETERETVLHESLHAMLAAGRLDTVLDNEAHGIAEHVVGTLAPILLAFIRENPEAIAYFGEQQ
jgi:hypothetical protein